MNRWADMDYGLMIVHDDRVDDVSWWTCDEPLMGLIWVDELLNE